MNRAQFKGPVSHTCLAGAMVATWSLMQEVTDMSPFTTNMFVTELNSANLVKIFRKDLYYLPFGIYVCVR